MGGMTDKQFTAYVRQILERIQDVIDDMPDGKDKLIKIALSLQKTIED